MITNYFFYYFYHMYQLLFLNFDPFVYLHVGVKNRRLINLRLAE